MSWVKVTVECHLGPGPTSCMAEDQELVEATPGAAWAQEAREEEQRRCKELRRFVAAHLREQAARMEQFENAGCDITLGLDGEEIGTLLASWGPGPGKPE